MMGEEASGCQGMSQLGSWVATEETDAVSGCVDTIEQCQGAGCFVAQDVCLAKMPILAEETVQRATLIKNSEIMFAGLLASRAYPIGHTVGGQWIAIPVQDASLRRAGNVIQPVMTNSSQAAEPPFPLANLALIGA
jgi:hypothetical protein